VVVKDAILSEGLELAMEFGPNWLKPIQGRLEARHPELSADELDEYERICRAALQLGTSEVPACWRQAGDEPGAFRQWSELVKRQYPWMSDSNLKHLFSQGCYYALKDGELPV
jgi:hypothetical protein